MDERELRACRRHARQAGISLSEWARRALRRAVSDEPQPSAESRLRALDRALACNHPTAGVEDMLKEIEAGRAVH